MVWGCFREVRERHIGKPDIFLWLCLEEQARYVVCMVGRVVWIAVWQVLVVGFTSHCLPAVFSLCCGTPPTTTTVPCTGEDSPGEGDREREQSGFPAKTSGVGGGQVVHTLLPHLHTLHSPRRACHVQPAVPYHASSEAWRVMGDDLHAFVQ